MKSQQWEALDLSLDGRKPNRFDYPRMSIKTVAGCYIRNIGIDWSSAVSAMLCALLACIQSPGPIIYRAKRVGRGGRIFEMYKFRTMVANAESLGAGLTIYGDSRITKLGPVSTVDEVG